MDNTDKDKLIASLRQQLREALSKISALEQEIFMLQHECKKTDFISPEYKELRQLIEINPIAVLTNNKDLSEEEIEKKENDDQSNTKGGSKNKKQQHKNIEEQSE